MFYVERKENGTLSSERVLIDRIRKNFPSLSIPRGANMFTTPDGSTWHRVMATSVNTSGFKWYEMETSTEVSLNTDMTANIDTIAVAASPEVIEARSSQAKEAAFATAFSLLRETDWTVIAALENPLIDFSSFVQYREDLRSISSQEGYPFEITWPTKPEVPNA